MDSIDAEKAGITYQLLNLAEYPFYFLCEERLKTFYHWPEFHHPKAEELAQGGFFYKQIGDRTQCFYCGLILKNWEKTDNVFNEHNKFEPDCLFVKMTYCKNKQEAVPGNKDMVN